MYGYFCMGFIDFMFRGKTLTDFTNLFLPYDFKKNEDYFSRLYFEIRMSEPHVHDTK